VSCHTEGDIAPFPLESYEEVIEVKTLVRYSVEAGVMPPWPPDDLCNNYRDIRALNEEERAQVITWLDEGTAEGDPADYVPDSTQTQTVEFDLDLIVPEAYTPQNQPDDYRCQIVDWPYEEEKYVTGFHVVPDQKQILHHTIAYVISESLRAEYDAMDANDDGPGYACFGGPGGPFIDDSDAGMRWLASWAPGGGARLFPAGTGIKVNPGDFVVLQMHYNMGSAEVAADRSMIRLKVEDTVDHPAMTIPYTNPTWLMGTGIPGLSMTIPAGEDEVSHETTDEYGGLSILSYQLTSAGFDTSRPLVVHDVALHMHYLGSSAILELHRASGEKECLIHIPDWDFNWQDGYELRETVTVEPGDSFRLRCTWDNSAENQPIIEGVQVEPLDVAWGDGTRDEMCLGVIYVTVP
jgi:hypothetical protein